MHRFKLAASFLVALALAIAACGSASGQSFSMIAQFNPTAGNSLTGNSPIGQVVISGSNLYGATIYGGPNSVGTIYNVPLSGGAPTILYSFGSTSGEKPTDGLTLDGSTLTNSWRDRRGLRAMVPGSVG